MPYGVRFYVLVSICMQWHKLYHYLRNVVVHRSQRTVCSADGTACSSTECSNKRLISELHIKPEIEAYRPSNAWGLVTSCTRCLDRSMFESNKHCLHEANNIPIDVEKSQTVLLDMPVARSQYSKVNKGSGSERTQHGHPILYRTKCGGVRLVLALWSMRKSYEDREWGLVRRLYVCRVNKYNKLAHIEMT